MKKYTFMIAFSPDRFIPFTVWASSLEEALNTFHHHLPHSDPEDVYSVDNEVLSLHSTQ